MRIANWLPKQDHARISINLQLPALGKRSSSGNPWSIPQPRLFNLNDSNRASCKNSVKKALEDRLEAFKESKDLDMLSENAARIIVEVSGVLESKSDTKFLPLVKREYDSVHEEGEIKRHLEVLFDRMIRMDFTPSRAR